MSIWQREDGEEEELKLRFLVVQSTQLTRRKSATLKQEHQREREQLEKRLASWKQREFACEADARDALKRFQKQQSLNYHRLEGEVYAQEVAGQYPRPGRPKKGEKRPKRTVFRMMRGISCAVLSIGGVIKKQVTTLEEEQVHILEFMGFDKDVYDLPRRKIPSPGMEIS